ncbi:MAG: FAD-dependent monooxygenase [Pseudomonadales bacterium]|nr:FAD-dependent monooxygenase [Pseudomonadales bacterium]
MSITIIGAGIAGLATAITLAKQGVSVQIFERSAALTHIGAGIVLWPNAIWVLKKFGLLEKIIAKSAALQNMRRFSSENQSLGCLSIEQINQHSGFTSRSILRADLLEILLVEALSLGVDIFYRHSVERIELCAEQFKVHFKHRKSIFSDAIIGADGRMNSVVRKYLLPENNPVYQGFVNVIGTAKLASDSDSPLDVLDYWGTGERFGIVPVSAHSAYWAAGWSSEKHIQDKNINPEQLLGQLQQRFASWPEPVQQLLENANLSSIKKLYIHDHHPSDTWSKGKILMLGDAAHAALPTSGQGACQALEDAWWLAHCVSLQGLTSESFRQFSQFRKEKTDNIIYSGRQIAKSIFNPDNEACKLRDRQSQQTDFSLSAKAMADFWMSGLS